MSVVVVGLQSMPHSPMAFSVAWLTIPLVKGPPTLLYTFARYRMIGKLPGVPNPVPWMLVFEGAMPVTEPSAVLYLLAPAVAPGQKFAGHCELYFPKE